MPSDNNELTKGKDIEGRNWFIKSDNLFNKKNIYNHEPYIINAFIKYAVAA